MRKLLSLLTLLLLAFSTACSKCGSTAPALEPDVSLSPDLLEKTVALVHQDSDGDWISYCAGVWVSPTTILTANHCVDDEPKTIMFLTHKDQTELYVTPIIRHDAKVLRLDPDHDLALLSATYEKASSFAVLASSSPPVGTPLILVGGPIGLTWTQMPGSVAGYRQGLRYVTPTEGPFMQISGGIFNGHSGGPAFDHNGRMVSLMILRSPAPAIGFGVHIDTIRKFIKN